jgi:hypothetical protein
LPAALIKMRWIVNFKQIFYLKKCDFPFKFAKSKARKIGKNGELGQKFLKSHNFVKKSSKNQYKNTKIFIM